MSMEQREFSRVAVKASASFDLPDGSVVVGEISDLSMNGVFVSCARRVALGTQGRLALVFGTGGADLVVRGMARVTRSVAHGFALQIDEVDLDSYHHLTHLVLYNSVAADQAQAEIDQHVGLKQRGG